MKAVVQRVIRASVSVDGEIVSSIRRGICVLIGICVDDDSKDVDFMVRKLLNLRIFDGEGGKRWDRSVQDCNYEIMCVSQFTLCCKLKGNKPDFHLAMPPDKSEAVYDDFLQRLRSAYDPNLVKNGKFAAFMQVDIQNDGPVTIELQSGDSSANKSNHHETDAKEEN